MLKIFLGILGVILVVALLTNNSSEKTPAPVPAPSAMGQQSPGTAAGAAKVNPAHGQPGHRCDIAVGAPLPSSPSASAPAAAMPPLKAPEAQLAVNPPHGQPGHSCDVPVGRPLPKK